MANKDIGSILPSLGTFIEVGAILATGAVTWLGIQKLEEWISRSWDEEAFLNDKIRTLQDEMSQHQDALRELQDARRQAEAAAAEGPANGDAQDGDSPGGLAGMIRQLENVG